jgi:site-specific recombinase XerD
MIERYFSRSWTLAGLKAAPLGAYGDVYTESLVQRGYSVRTIRHHVSLIGQLNKWLRSHTYELIDLDQKKIDHFLRERKKKRRSVISAGDNQAIKLLIETLQVKGAKLAPGPIVEVSQQTQTELDFAKYLLRERALAAGTIKGYVGCVRYFLTDIFHRGLIDYSELGSPDVTSFLLRFAQQRRGRSKTMVCALRAFFRFLRLRGDITIDLAASVPTVPNWRLTSLPKYIEANQVKLLLSQCDKRTAKGLRDHAILLLLSRFGLRAGEVVSLTLDDINWESGEVTVHGKGAVQSRFPLPTDVGNALANYIKNSRKRCSSRSVFIRDRPPYRGFANSVAISTIVRRYFDQAGLDLPHTGAHVLRHTVATQIIRQGAKLSDVSELLRHKNLNTSAIYAKVDIERLKKVAHPWPLKLSIGGGQ